MPIWYYKKACFLLKWDAQKSSWGNIEILYNMEGKLNILTTLLLSILISEKKLLSLSLRNQLDILIWLIRNGFWLRVAKWTCHGPKFNSSWSCLIARLIMSAWRTWFHTFGFSGVLHMKDTIAEPTIFRYILLLIFINLSSI